ncbi:hypothetical protein AJ80_02605 [Polytolypa hystricis UAMH7299]|uniref:Uncharacterized protein n=1 Tax=Polytolypa hystricis (strain UAMH7299) TaxID=1447883 RepID=A0A2B7YR65_POLH7|nr:hypothetical protein AJ80_02605 [Polytolypa hystricis UAMH7299]
MPVLAGPTKRKLSEVEGFETRDNWFPRSRHNSSAASMDRPSHPNHATQHDAARSRTDVRSHNSGQSTTYIDPQPFHDTLSEPTSRRSSPTSFDTPLRTSRKFENNASIVLVGISGTGKSSLAVILSAATGRRLVHADRYFEQVTGMTRATFKKEHGAAEYRQQEAMVMESMLVKNGQGCVIDCSPGSLERSGQKLLRAFAKTHPVVHILRDPVSIQAYIKAWDTEKVRRFLTLSGPLYRGYSNLEFFNISEQSSTSQEDKNGYQDSRLGPNLDELSRTTTPFLTLKRVERDFLQFIAYSAGDSIKLTKPLDSFPLSKLPIESRMFTYASSVPLSAMLERHLDLEELESTADAFELRVDVAQEACDGNSGVDPELADKISQTVATIRRSIIIPLIYHAELHLPTDTPGTNTAEIPRRSDNAYLNVLEHGLRFAPDFLTVDLSYSDEILSRIISSKGQTRIVGHFHFLQPPPQSWNDPHYMAMYERAMKLGCDLVRLSQPAVTMEDNFAVQRFHHKIRNLPNPHPPLIAYNSGPLGRLSCCFNPILTPVTHPVLMSTERSHYQPVPCLTAHEARTALFSSFALDPMRFYVFGAHVTYSLSPAMHNTAYKACGLPHIYTFHQSPTIRGLNELVKDPYFGGSSLGLPYKSEVVPLLDSMSPHARAIGACNTVIPIRSMPADGIITSDTVFQEKSRAGPVKALYGDNTDWIGMRNCLRRGLSPANAVRPSSTGLVIGAGGMARAAVYSIIQMGVQNIFVWNRTVSNAQKLAHHYNRQDLSCENAQVGKATVHVIESLSEPWPANYKQPTIVISGIPQHSVHGEPAPNFELPKQWIESPTGGVVLELAYKPLDTPLVCQMRALSHRGWVALDGLDVLPEQGFAQFELFTGHRSPRRLMRAIVRKEYKGEEGQYDPAAD